MKKTKRILAAVLAAATVLVSAGSPAVFAASSETAVSSAAEVDLSNYTGWMEDSVGSRYYVNGVLQTKSKVIDGIRYKISADGYSQGKYTGWTKSAKGKRYWKDGKLIKNDWIKTPNGKLYYAGEKGYMTVGWSDVTRIGGAYSYFDEKGVWDGKVYWSKSNPAATRENMLNERIRIKIKPVETIIGSDIKWSKKEKQYLENNSSYELELPRSVAETFRVGDTIIVRAKVTRGEKKNGVYDYYLDVSGYNPKTYVGTIGTVPYYEVVDRLQDGTLDEEDYAAAIENRLDLFNKLFLIRDDKLMLDRMFQVLGLSWEEIKGNQEIIDYVKDCHLGVYSDIDAEAYALFGGYNPLDEETGLRVYRDGMEKQELIALMREVSDKIRAEMEADANDPDSDTDYYDWVYNTGGFWFEARIEEIPSVS